MPPRFLVLYGSSIYFKTIFMTMHKKYNILGVKQNITKYFLAATGSGTARRAALCCGRRL